MHVFVVIFVVFLWGDRETSADMSKGIYVTKLNIGKIGAYFRFSSTISQCNSVLSQQSICAPKLFPIAVVWKFNNL